MYELRNNFSISKDSEYPDVVVRTKCREAGGVGRVDLDVHLEELELEQVVGARRNNIPETVLIWWVLAAGDDRRTNLASRETHKSVDTA